MKLPLPVEIVKWQRDPARTRLGVVDILLPAIGLTIRRASLHRFNNIRGRPTVWLSMPQIVFDDEKGQRQTFAPCFFTRHIHEQLFDEVLRQISERDPELFAETTEEKTNSKERAA